MEGDVEASAYNRADSPTWGRVWQADNPQNPVSEGWAALLDAFRARAPLGRPAPPLQGPVVGGGTFSLEDRRGRGPTVVVFGSLTCPPFIAALRTSRPSLVSLHQEVRDRGVEMVCVYTREAHPGSSIRPHATLEEKATRASELVAEEELPFPVVVDDLAGTLHRSYSDAAFNSPAYLLDSGGRVVYKAAWLDPADLRSAVHDHLRWEERHREGVILKKTVTERMYLIDEQPATAVEARVRQVLERAGADFRPPGSPVAGARAGGGP